jgi:hypothetical protein
MHPSLSRLTLALCGVVLTATIGVAAQAAVPPAPKAPAVAGTWAGEVTSDSGTMQVTVTIKVDQGKVSGSIDTPHGQRPIADGTEKDGTWTLPFTVEGAGDRWMKGKVDGDRFTGDWNNAPMAVGTFDLTRVKKS